MKDLTNLGRSQLIAEIRRLTGLLEQTQAKLEAETAEARRLQHANQTLEKQAGRVERQG